MKKFLLWLTLSLATLSILKSQNFDPGSLVVLQAEASASNTTCSVIEINRTSSGQAALSTYVIDGTGTNALRFSGSATSTGYLSRSNDKTLVTFMGANNSTTSPTNANTLNPRAVGTLNAARVFSLQTTYTGTSGSQTRSATTINNSDWFITDQGGIYSNAATSASPTGNFRSIRSFGGTVYISQSSSTVTNIQVNTISAAVAGTLTGLPGLLNNASFQDFYLISSGSNGAAFDILYTLSATSNTAATIAKYSLVSGSWTAIGTYITSFGGFGIAAETNGSGADLYLTTGQGALTANSVIKLNDVAGYNATIDITTANNITLYTAPTGKIIKGVEFAPLTPPLSVNISVSANSGSEVAETVVTVTATATNAVSGSQTVDVVVSGAGITAGDYSLSSTTITIPDGQTTGSATFTVLNDAVVEGIETATLTLTNPSAGFALGATVSQNIAIIDDEIPPTVTLASSTSIIKEGASTSITFTATASAAVNGNQTVGLELTGNGVTVGDYSLTSSTITILNGATSGTATFTVVDDTELEGSEIVTVAIKNPSSNIVLGATTIQRIFIHDNDFPAAPVGNNEIQLNFVSSYLNVGRNPGNSAEISAYDPTSKRLFVVNSLGRKMNILDFSNPSSITNVATIDISSFGGINSIAVKNGTVVVAIEATNLTGDGSVLFYNSSGELQKQVTVGAMPDMITYSPNGNLVLTANEGEPSDDYLTDPEGTVSIIDISGGIANLSQSNVTTVNFNSFDSQLATLRSQGLRVYGANNPTLSKDLEPEYIAFSAEGNTAFVTLQENNAIAVLDIPSKTFTAIRPLGLKDHNLLHNGLDASDNGGVANINIANLPIKGMYQPDAIATYTINNENYIVTANEGDSRVYPRAGSLVGAEGSIFSEEARVSTLTLDPTIFPNRSLLQNALLLGRLQLTNKTGDTDVDGDFDEIHALGARSFSIWKATPTALQLVFDSGDQLERITLADATYGSIFNASHDNNTPKNRSDNKGPEPEGVSIAQIDGKTYAFIALERMGGVMVYNITNPNSPVFVQWANNRGTSSVTGDRGSEGIFFISAIDSPTGVPLVVVSNEVSSTISVFSVGGGNIPLASSGLTALNNNTQLAVDLSWTDNSTNETGFQIQRSLNASTGFVAIATLSANALNYIDNTVGTNTIYFYRVVAYNDFGVSPSSNTISATTKQNQTITFAALAAKTFGDAAFNLAATTTSGISITYASSDPAIASISGNTVTITKAGIVDITASQVGDAEYLPATSVVQSLAINKAAQTITFTAIPAKTFSDAAFNLAATSTSGLAITYASSDPSIASISGNTVTIKKAGIVNITASQEGDAEYLPATSVVQSLTINKAAQTISFTAIPTKTVGDVAFSLTATATSTLAPTFSTTSDKVTLAGSQVTIVKAGSVTITASQTGNENYNIATAVDNTFCINPAKPTITTSNLNTESPILTSSVTPGNQWFLNDVVIAGATNATLSASAEGIYKVQVKVDDCLSEFSSNVTFIVTGDLRPGHSLVSFYPNPVEDYLQIVDAHDIISSRIFDMAGRERAIVLEKTADGYRANLIDLPSGVYILRLIESTTAYQLKFIKK